MPKGCRISSSQSPQMEYQIQVNIESRAHEDYELCLRLLSDPCTMAGFEIFSSEIVSTLCFGLKPTKDTFNGKNDIKLIANFCQL